MSTLTNRQINIINQHIDDFSDNKFPSKHKHMAFVFLGSKLLSVSCNDFIRNKDKPYTYSKYTVHAEINMLINLQKKNIKPSNQLKLISVCFHQGKLKNAMPCTNCCRKLKEFGIENILFTDSTGTFRKSRIDTICTKISSGDRK